MVIPFFMALFPAVWYINRNVMTEQLLPYTEPTPDLVVLAITVAIVGSLLIAAVITFFRDQNNVEDSELRYRQRVFHPDNTALVVFFVFIAVTFVFILTEMVGFGPAWLGAFLQILLIPVAIPLLVLAPLAIQFHWAVIAGLVLCVLWMSLLGNVISDIVHGRPLPLRRN